MRRPSHVLAAWAKQPKSSYNALLRMRFPFVLAGLALSLLGCSGDTANPADSGADAPSEANPIGRQPPPQVQNQGGTVEDAPHVVPIFFAADADQVQVEDFLKQLAQSSYWSAATSEYGVGALTIGSSVVVTDAPPKTIDTVGIEQWLTAQTGLPPFTQNNVFAIFYPSSTTISDLSFGTSCVDFAGFHYQGIKNPSLVYAVLPRCAKAGELVGLDGLTASLSHELVEAATDPLLATAPAWGFTDDDHIIWSFVPGAEIADMCALEPRSFDKLVGSYYAQRVWSNAAALAGHDPCVPAPSQPYFNAAPVFTTSTNIDFQAHYISTKGVEIALGDSRTIAVKLFADAPTSDWSVQAIDASRTPGLTFSWDNQTGNDGDVLHLTITRTATTSSEFILESRSSNTTNLWFGFVAD